MLKKIFALFVLIVIISFAGGFVILSLKPFSVDVSEKSRNLAKKIAKYASSIVYREATLHNPSGDVVPDGIDDRIKQKIKDTF